MAVKSHSSAGISRLISNSLSEKEKTKRQKIAADANTAMQKQALANQGRSDAARIGESGATQRTGMQQAGATQRAAMGEKGATTRTGMNVRGQKDVATIRGQTQMDVQDARAKAADDAWTRDVESKKSAQAAANASQNNYSYGGFGSEVATPPTTKKKNKPTANIEDDPDYMQIGAM